VGQSVNSKPISLYEWFGSVLLIYQSHNLFVTQFKEKQQVDNI
jgi:hypothetical protein